MNTSVIVLTLIMTVFFVVILATAVLATGWHGSDSRDTTADRAPTEDRTPTE